MVRQPTSTRESPVIVDPLIVRLISVGFSLLFLLAAAHKLTNFASFRITLADYQMLPPALLDMSARLIPLLEIVLGLGWLLSLPTFHVPVATGVLLYAYLVAMSINLMRGRSHIDCGCGFSRSSGSRTVHQLSFGLIIRNLVLVAVALTALMPVGDRSLGMLDFLVLVLAIITAIFLYAAANQLTSNNCIIGAWRNQRG